MFSVDSKVNVKTRVVVAGSRGMVGSALMRTMQRRHDFAEPIGLSRDDVDFFNQVATYEALADLAPDWLIISAARVGGIIANDTYPGEFIYQNLSIQNNLIEGARLAGVRHLIFLGSACIYPKYADVPIEESALLTGHLEPSNESYAIAKIAGIKMCEAYVRQYGLDYRSLMPTNLYGIGDNYHPLHSHVLPGLMRRFYEAKVKQHSVVKVWGTGRPTREFLFADDLADAILHVMSLPTEVFWQHVPVSSSHVNVGGDSEVTIELLAKSIAKVVGYSGEIEFDSSIPDGTPRRRLSQSLMNDFGWRPRIKIEDGLKLAYKDFLVQMSYQMGLDLS